MGSSKNEFYLIFDKYSQITIPDFSHKTPSHLFEHAIETDGLLRY